MEKRVRLLVKLALIILWEEVFGAFIFFSGCCRLMAGADISMRSFLDFCDLPRCERFLEVPRGFVSAVDFGSVIFYVY